MMTEPTGSPLCEACGKPTDGTASVPVAGGRIHVRCQTPAIDITSDAQNAFVQGWLSYWAREHTVYGSDDWKAAAQAKIDADPEHAKRWGLSVRGQVRDAELVEGALEMIQETYGAEEASRWGQRGAYHEVGVLNDPSINVNEVRVLTDGSLDEYPCIRLQGPDVFDSFISWRSLEHIVSDLEEGLGEADPDSMEKTLEQLRALLQRANKPSA